MRIVPKRNSSPLPHTSLLGPTVAGCKLDDKALLGDAISVEFQTLTEVLASERASEALSGLLAFPRARALESTH